MGQKDAGHGSEGCRCVVSAGWLKEVRRRRMVSLEAMSAASDYSREELAAIERGEVGRCATPEIVGVYENAMGVSMETEVLAVLEEFLQAVVAARGMLARLHQARALLGR